MSSREIEFAGALAKRVGKIQMERLGGAHTIEYKGVINLVTEVDKECEALIVGELRRHFPKDGILAEEGTNDRSESPRRWIVDPLDGTVNYAHGFPFFSVSIALEEKGSLTIGVVYDPTRDELFSAGLGGGAFLNDRPIHVSQVHLLQRALVATGFAYNVWEGEQLDNIDNFTNFIKRAQAVRRPGSSAIDLAWVACGRLDGFWELFLKPWDIAAGALIVKEAGGAISSFDGSALDLYGTEILASNGKIHGEMSELLSRPL